jgi:hypothetical protein
MRRRSLHVTHWIDKCSLPDVGPSSVRIPMLTEQQVTCPETWLRRSRSRQTPHVRPNNILVRSPISRHPWHGSSKTCLRNELRSPTDLSSEDCTLKLEHRIGCSKSFLRRKLFLGFRHCELEEETFMLAIATGPGPRSLKDCNALQRTSQNTAH